MLKCVLSFLEDLNFNNTRLYIIPVCYQKSIVKEYLVYMYIVHNTIDIYYKIQDVIKDGSRQENVFEYAMCLVVCLYYQLNEAISSKLILFDHYLIV